MLIARSGDELEDLAQSCRGRGVEVACQRLDLTNPESIASGVAALLQQGEQVGN